MLMKFFEQNGMIPRVPRHTGRLFPIALSVMLLACAGCSQLFPADAKKEAKERWAGVRARLKYELAQESFTAGQFEEAQKHLDESLTLKPDSGEAYVLQAKILLEKGQTASASEALDEAQRHGTDSAETDYLSGVISQRYEKLDDALAWYRRAAQREPMSAPYVVAVAETLVSMGRVSEALELVNSRMTDFEENATLRAVAGEIYMMLDRYEEAADAYRDASRIAPDDAQLKEQLGFALALSRKYEEGSAVLASANLGADAQSSMLVALGRCRLGLNEGDEAKEVLRRAVDTDPGNAGTWVLLARACATSKDLLTARRAAAQAVQIEPSNRIYRLLLGCICWEQQDRPATVAALEQVQQGGDDALAMYMLADCYRSMGKQELSQALVRRALESDPQCAWARQWTDTPRNKPVPAPRGRAAAR